MKYLVTGGAGFIGSNIVERLLSDGNEVVVIDNESSDAHDAFYWNESAFNSKADICDYESIRPMFDGVDYVFHLAAESSIQPTIINPLLAVKTNSLGTATVLQCAREAGVKRVVYSSTSSAYGCKNEIPNHEEQHDDCLNPYSVSKVAGEKLCSMYSNLYELETVILRYFNVYGNNQPTRGQYAPVIGLFLRQKAANEPLTIVGDGEQRRDFTNVLDVVNANILACQAEIPQNMLGNVFNVGTGISYSINEIAEMISDKSVTVPARLGESRFTLANNSKAKKIFGWHPTVDLKEYIKSKAGVSDKP